MRKKLDPTRSQEKLLRTWIMGRVIEAFNIQVGRGVVKNQDYRNYDFRTKVDLMHQCVMKYLRTGKDQGDMFRNDPELDSMRKWLCKDAYMAFRSIFRPADKPH